MRHLKEQFEKIFYQTPDLVPEKQKTNTCVLFQKEVHLQFE